MEATIQITEQEIAEHKAKWMDAQLQQYMGLDYWKRNATQDELLSEIRKKHSLGSEMYLTEAFKKDLQIALRDQVHKLVDEELKRINRTVGSIVKTYIFEKLDELVQETLKDAVFTTQSDYQSQFVEEGE